MEGLEDTSHLLAQHAKQRRFEKLDHRDVHAVIAQRRRYLTAYEPHTGDHCPLTAPAFNTDAVGVSHRAQFVDPFKVSSRNAQPAVTYPCGNEHLVIRHTITILQFDHLLTRVNPGCADTKLCVDVVVNIEAVRLEQGLLERFLALEIFLRKRRPFVGRVRFCAYEHDLAVETFFPEGNGRYTPGQIGPNNHELLLHRTFSLSCDSLTCTARLASTHLCRDNSLWTCQSSP